ncbi:MAG: peptidase M22, partial [Eubacterium sp.]|nr:peptidase M22 [Eubacterium sp.]
DGKSVVQEKQLLSVKHGEKGLRQSDAVFQHTVNLPKLIEKLDISNLKGVGVSTQPRSVEGSYMPCFLVGEGAAVAASASAGVPLYKTSHQTGHILAALYSAGRLDLINERHIAFHISGGTTEALLVSPDNDKIINSEIIASSSDLKAGQAIDRAGVMLGLQFPCGKALDELSQKSETVYKYKPSMNGLDCSLSGIENKTKDLVKKGEAPENIAKFVLTCISQSVLKMLDAIKEEYGNLPVIFSGGVSSNSLLRKTILAKYNAYFAEPAFSLDNAAGCAIYAYLKDKEI